MPRISVVTVVLNAVDRVGRALESVAAQRYADKECIVIDGGSTDGTLDVLKRMDAHIDYLVSEADRGLYHAMNKGTHAASGDFVYFLNSDDCFSDSAVLEDVAAAVRQHNDADLVYGDVLIRQDGHPVRKPQIPILNRETFCRRGLCHQALFARRSALLDNGGFSEDYRIVSDGDWMARTIAAGARSHHMDRDIAIISTDGLSWSTNWRDEKRRCLRANYTAWELFRWRKLPGLLGLRKD